MKFANIDETGQIEKVASAEESRYSVSHVFFDAEKGRLVATNGHAMAIAHVYAEPGEVTGFIPREALAEYRKLLKANRIATAVTIFCNAFTIEIEDKLEGRTISYRRPPFSKGQFPNYEAVLPKVQGPPAFTLNIDLLKSLAEALGGDPRSKMIAVWPSAGKGKDTRNSAYMVKTSTHGAVGIIMPMRSDEKGWLTTLEQVEELMKPKPKVAAKELDNVTEFPKPADAPAVAEVATSEVEKPVEAVESGEKVGEQTSSAA
jgi:hypothetical protein